MFKIFIAALKGTGAFRFYLQPLMAFIRGIKHGRHDYQQGLSPLLSRLLGEEKLKDVFREGVHGVAPVLLIALLLDLYAQWEIFHYIHVVMTMLVLMLIVLIPYFIARDFTNRFCRLRNANES